MFKILYFSGCGDHTISSTSWSLFFHHNKVHDFSNYCLPVILKYSSARNYMDLFSILFLSIILFLPMRFLKNKCTTNIPVGVQTSVLLKNENRHTRFFSPLFSLIFVPSFFSLVCKRFFSKNTTSTPPTCHVRSQQLTTKRNDF